MRGTIAALSFAACLAPAAASAQSAVDDPWEGMNRNLYGVHDAIDQAVLEPVARGYRAVTTSGVRHGVSNVLANLRNPVTFVNDVLQGKPSRAGVTAARFGVNTTIGVLGIWDPAQHMGLEPHVEDFGQTLGVWGVNSGPYLFIPVLGPTNVRDGFGRIIDIAFDPFTWAKGEDADTFRVTRTIVGGVSTREGLLEAVDDVRATSIDPYVSFRTTYNTLRDADIRDGRSDPEDLPNFDDIPASPESTAPPAAEAPATPDSAVPSVTEGNRQHSMIIKSMNRRAPLVRRESGAKSASPPGDNS